MQTLASMPLSSARLAVLVFTEDQARARAEARDRKMREQKRVFLVLGSSFAALALAAAAAHFKLLGRLRDLLLPNEAADADDAEDTAQLDSDSAEPLRPRRALPPAPPRGKGQPRRRQRARPEPRSKPPAPELEAAKEYRFMSEREKPAGASGSGKEEVIGGAAGQVFTTHTSWKTSVEHKRLGADASQEVRRVGACASFCFLLNRRLLCRGRC